MSTDQAIVFTVLVATLALFVWDRIRFDIVAMLALLAVAVTGLVPSKDLFSGFGHPAIITVAAVLVISQGLVNAGVVDSIARQLGRVGDNPTLQVITITGVVALCSGFINNVGALALLMPVAIWMARESGRSPSFLLMPLAFGSLLGGTMTLIGTPPNIIIASYREGDANFGLLDFLPVGATITVVGLAFISLVGWRLTPRREDSGTGKKLFSVGDYVTELRVPEGSDYVGQTLHDLIVDIRDEADIAVLALVRDDDRKLSPSTHKVLRAGDVLLVQTDTDNLQSVLDRADLELGEPDEGRDELEEGDARIVEAVITPDSHLTGETANRLRLRERHGLNVIAVARQGRRLKERVGQIKLRSGDILLVQGQEDSLSNDLREIGALPLAERGLRFKTERRTWVAAGIFLLAIVSILAGALQPPVALVAAAVLMVVASVLDANEAYKAIDWSVIVLLGAMIPVGTALETTGGAELLASQLFAAGESLSPGLLLAVLVAGTMILSNIVNNAAAAILVAPIALSISDKMGIASDATLMAVAVGASCAFLTPIGHQSNALVMEPGGYEFGDYWRLGLPLSALVVVTSVPVILWVWG
ncbi:Di-and tricarboxylate transporter [Marinobacter daqiaonensis]|uniref:Di-and tricarboxylate transporter n=1 Tax=Marinobacter daqiaonensis TaxID=650891 RepID=A0A1I6JTY9_9GAMM|nr:SLC13 family permease [Marinobacter daqiaonensis]SFR82378.1 Di-and tricarboxylate transporter [Marinobacter daqiaonensis]